MSKTIAIVAPSPVPFQIGGAEQSWVALRLALAQWSGHLVELIKLPAREESFSDVIGAYEMFSSLDLSHFDMLISTKYPAWMTPHPNHVVYMYHPLRGLYDMYHYCGLPERIEDVPAPLKDLVALVRNPAPGREDLPEVFALCKRALANRSLPSRIFRHPGPLMREVVHFFDRIALAPGQIAAYLALSRSVRNRKDYFPAGVNVRILPLPSGLTPEQCRNGEYFFTASRLSSPKRIDLIIDAMRYVKADIPLKIAGTGSQLEYLRQRAEGDQRIEFLGFVPDSDLPGLYAGAIAVPFVPRQEDYGLITIEAMQAGKPVITVSDAGGVCELVEHGRNGFCVEPAAPALGMAMQRLADDPGLAREMGITAQHDAAKITWRETALAIMSHAALKGKNSSASRKKILVCNTFTANEHGSGGERRLYHFCSRLASDYEVVLIAPGAMTDAAPHTRQLGPRFLELTLPWQQTAIEDSDALFRQMNFGMEDVAIMRHCADDERLCRLLEEEGKNAHCVITAHPYLFPAINRALPEVALVYDAYNVEADVKAAIPGAASICAEVAEVEGQCCRRADLVFTCTADDAERFRTLYEISAQKLVLLPNGCSCAPRMERRSLVRERLPYKLAKLAIFIGSWHPPNIDAVRHIFSFARKLPEVQFIVAGGVCAARQFRGQRKPDNLHLVGRVSENVKNILLHACDVALNPMLGGSGSNLKIVEYLGSGLECVSTPFGVRGLSRPFPPILHVCEIGDFPQIIHRVLTKPMEDDMAMRLGRELAKQFDWKAALEPLCPAIARICSRETISAIAD